MVDFLAYAGLFLTAFLAATILPAQSEAVLGGMIVAGSRPIWLLVTIASLGNILGSLLNWMFGRGIEQFRHHRWFPASERDLDKAQAFYRKWGCWSLLLSWVPIIGDPLTIVAGIMREPLIRFLVLVAIAKIGRYLALTALVLHWL
jgi:membrane protein YqaA with SNARE-associated domain